MWFGQDFPRLGEDFPQKAAWKQAAFFRKVLEKVR